MQYYIPANYAQQKKKEQVLPSKLYIQTNIGKTEETTVASKLIGGFANERPNKSTELGEWIGLALAAGYIDTDKMTTVAGADASAANTAAGAAGVKTGAAFKWTDGTGTHLMIKT